MIACLSLSTFMRSFGTCIGNREREGEFDNMHDKVVKYSGMGSDVDDVGIDVFFSVKKNRSTFDRMCSRGN